MENFPSLPHLFYHILPQWGPWLAAYKCMLVPVGRFYHQMSHSPSGTFVMLPPSGRCLPSGYMLKGFFLNVEGDACRIVSFVFNPLVY